MSPNDERLRALLRQWCDIEPSVNFEANVRRRIRLAQEKPERVTVVELLRRWQLQPALSFAAAVAVSVMIGSSLGVLTAPKPTAATSSELQFLSPGTLTGGYLKLTSEGVR